jgi:hypothetical protein
MKIHQNQDKIIKRIGPHFGIIEKPSFAQKYPWVLLGGNVTCSFY